MVTFLTIV